jgi:hypothetical protein
MDPTIVGDVVISNISSETFLQTISEVGQIGLWLQTLGVIVVLWLIFQIISLIITWNKMKMLNKMMNDLKRLETKIDRKLNAIDKKLSRR